MARIRPPEPRSKITEIDEGLVIRIPVARNWTVITFISIFFLMMSCGVAFAVIQGDQAQQPQPGQPPPLGPEGLIFLSIFSLVFLAALGLPWVWNIFGREVITVTEEYLSIRHEVLGIGRSRIFDLEHIQTLRYAAPVFDYWQVMYAFYGFGQGSIAFDYGAKTFRFGSNIDEPEAKVLIETIKQRFPGLDQNSSL
jgi:hypothetical protein